MLNRPVINEWKGSDEALMEFADADLHLSGLTKEEEDARRADILERLGQKLHIQFAIETRPIETWIIQPTTAPAVEPATKP